MSFGAAIRSVLGKYATFSGRARRSEYWWWTLATSLVSLALYLLALGLLGGAAALSDPAGSELGGAGAGAGVAGLLVLGLFFLLSLALFVPSLAVTVRRLHDTGRSGWWYLISLVPFGGIVLIVFAVMDSTPGPNEHGPNPKGVGDAGYGYGGQVGYAQQGPDQRFGAAQA